MWLSPSSSSTVGSQTLQGEVGTEVKGCAQKKTSGDSSIFLKKHQSRNQETGVFAKFHNLLILHFLSYKTEITFDLSVLTDC